MDQDFVDRLMARGLISQGGFDRATERMMTHEAPQPNPAQPYLDATTQAMRTGLGFAQGGLQGLGLLDQAPNWMQSNPVQRAVQNPDNRLALEGAFWKIPGMAAKADKLIEQGYGQRAIADELGVGKASVGRYLAQSGQKTAAAESPINFWKDNPGAEDVLRAEVNKGTSFAKIANKLGTSTGGVWQKFKQFRDAGEFPDYDRVSANARSLLADPDKRADLIRMASEGESQGNIASYFYGGLGGKHPRRGDISKYIKQLREEGELQNYVPQDGTGITAAGRAPTLPQLKSQSREAPPPDRDYMKALQEYLRGQGLTGLAMPQYG